MTDTLLPLKVYSPILFFIKDVLAVIPALGYMMQFTRPNNSRASWHDDFVSCPVGYVETSGDIVRG
ncbi:MAG: hypothetical protein KAR05_09465 [Candidatus Omnitrophica bacterium]|nr:hypothetical protein [Candidatus Omnitrophota bacterium]